jgi:lysyl-tRNA synthetase class 2
VTTDWRPTAPIEILGIRAKVLRLIRAFFAERDVLEVETPLLGSAPVTDVHLHAMSCRYRGPGHDEGRRLWLQTSPEFAMKRLLASGCGPIYQLCKAFRAGEAGSRHNPEFTMLEWYRPGWDHHRLMDEVEELLGAVLGSGRDGRGDQWPTAAAGTAAASGGSGTDRRQRSAAEAGGRGRDSDQGQRSARAADGDGMNDGEQGRRTAAAPVPGIPFQRFDGWQSERLTYAEVFQRHLGIDPFAAAIPILAASARSRIHGAIPDLGDDRDGWLELLLSHVIEPKLGFDSPTFIYDFPASQAALARIRPGDPSVAERFEAWIDGVELANGYHELTDPIEQRRRFDADLADRRRRDLPEVPLDERLLAALEHGMPSCAGVALGVDRLVMLAAGVARIDEVIAFPIDRA